MSNIFDLFKKIEKSDGGAPITHLIVGLGNPGAEYADTRHNAGFLCVDRIAEAAGARIDRAKFHALVGEGRIGGARVLLMKPQTYMNNSGVAVAEAATFYKIPAENIIVIHDEISFAAGLFRIRRKGSAGGHNGIKSIIAHIGSDGFPRLKIGVGQKPTPEYDLAAWVLGKLSREDKENLAKRYPDVVSSVELMVAGKIDEAMNRYSK